MAQQEAWDSIADYWEASQSKNSGDGNDMFTECLLPVLDELVGYQPGQTVLDLGTGTGIVARHFAKKGAEVIGLDFSEAMIEIAKTRAENVDIKVEYEKMDLMEFDHMEEFAHKHPNKFDIITISTTLKSLSSLEPIAEALPLLLKECGCVVIVDLHPAFSKPAGHRAMEVFEDPTTGKQQLQTWIKVENYLEFHIRRARQSEDNPCHSLFSSLLEPFVQNGLVVDRVREPAFANEGADLEHPQSYHNFPQFPMLLAIRLKHK
ncbi:hypothetical protein LTR22_026796 [Elasticomyces elasticus]|nr:hypothetical protein LTR22_026796 [Elasticomyces elasticus]